MLRTGWTWAEVLATPAHVLDVVVEELVAEQERQAQQQGQPGGQPGEPAIEMG